MTELIKTNANCTRWGLMAGVSALTLIACISGIDDAVAAGDDNDRPSVWIELGGQLERVESGPDRFAPSFVDAVEAVPFASPVEFQRPARYSNGIEGKISFEPKDSDWTFSLALRYGRSNSSKHQHEQTPNLVRGLKIYFTPSNYGVLPRTPAVANFTDTVSVQKESHTVLDFSAGKDVGVGLFGSGSSSSISFGIRFAQFASRSQVTLDAVPDRYFPTIGLKSGVKYYKYDTRYSALADINRSFRGIGPSLTLNGEVSLVGQSDASELTFDWGINAAVLFGRQKVKIHHQTTVRYYKTLGGERAYVGGYAVTRTVTSRERSRFKFVPNIGGFAGVSLHFPNAKVSLGYRADFFFGAMDGGIDERRTNDVGFHGPFATISIGLGG
jgi:hypothetical protein